MRLPELLLNKLFVFEFRSQSSELLPNESKADLLFVIKPVKQRHINTY
jgi:hypothetical protein